MGERIRYVWMHDIFFTIISPSCLCWHKKWNIWLVYIYMWWWSRYWASQQLIWLFILFECSLKCKFTVLHIHSDIIYIIYNSFMGFAKNGMKHYSNLLINWGLHKRLVQSRHIKKWNSLKIVYNNSIFNTFKWIQYHSLLTNLNKIST